MLTIKHVVKQNSSMKRNLEITIQGITDFLSGDMVEGVGKIYARRLVEKYGIDAVSILKEHPLDIKDIRGLSENRLIKASESINSIKYSLDFILFLYSTGIRDLFINRILNKYRKQSENVVLENPYQMIEEVWRLSFFTADKIGVYLGIRNDDIRRIKGAVLTTIKHYAEDGHLYATPDEAMDYASTISELNIAEYKNHFVMAIDSLISDGRIIASKGGLYLPVYYEAEHRCAEKLIEISTKKVKGTTDFVIPMTDIDGNNYSEEQIKAIEQILSYPFTILTGGPGSGKTAVLKGVLDILNHKKILLCAPTGRAAKRMTHLTGYEACTIHRALGYREGEGYFNKNIDVDVLVIDESSMMEQVLLDHLIDAVGTDCKLIMIGDSDQLPAIGAGNVLNDLIASGVVPVITLTGNFRQREGSGIVLSAMSINRGKYPKSDEEDFVIIEESGIDNIHNTIIRMVTSAIPELKGVSPFDIIVVTPEQKGPLGARQLNADLQNSLNPSGPEIKRGQTIFRLNDPVMQTHNSSARNLYNGETGRIIAVDEYLKYIEVQYEVDKISRYERNELNELVLAYATTVHKLQGSEADYIVIPVTMLHRPMLYRNLIYTAVSRAKKMCVIVGEPDALRFAVANSKERTRNSKFAERLRDLHNRLERKVSEGDNSQ